jgi:hypothetical protein
MPLGTVHFTNVEDMATFIATLVVKGVTFKAFSTGAEYVVELTGGY